MCLASTGAADKDDVALVSNEAAGSQFPDKALVDRRSGKIEFLDIFGERELGDGHLVADGPRLFLGDLGLQQIADDARRFMLALDAASHDLIISAAHPVELQRAHQVEDLGAFHVGWSS